MIRIAPSIIQLLPITDEAGLCEAIGRYRSQRFQLRQAEVQQAVRLLIDRYFEKAQELHDELTRSGNPEPVRYAAELYHLWGFVDGLIYGKTKDLLPPDQVTALRKEWTDRCDTAFGSRTGEVLGLHR